MSDKIEPSANRSGIVVRAVSWIQPLGNFRDGILIIASASYIVGYAVWSYNAMQNKLGLLSAIDAQYFVAGAVPIFILLTSYFIGRYLKRLSDQWPAYVGVEAIGGRLLLRNALILFYRITLIMLAAHLLLSKLFTIPDYTFLIVVGFNSILVLFMPPQANIVTYKTRLYPKTIDFDKIVNLYRSFMTYYLVALFMVGGVIFYIQKVYPYLPQEFGGVRPRCAYIDVKSDQVSKETFRALTMSNVVTLTSQVVRSVPVEILISSKEHTIIRSQGKTYDIVNGVIQVMNPCD